MPLMILNMRCKRKYSVIVSQDTERMNYLGTFVSTQKYTWQLVLISGHGKYQSLVFTPAVISPARMHCYQCSIRPLDSVSCSHWRPCSSLSASKRSNTLGRLAEVRKKRVLAVDYTMMRRKHFQKEVQHSLYKR